MNAVEEILALDALHVGVLRDLVAELDDCGRFEEAAAAYEALQALQSRIQSRGLPSPCPVIAADTTCAARPQLCEDGPRTHVDAAGGAA